MDRIVYSPHIYGPDVYDHAYFKSPKLKETLKEVRPYFHTTLGMIEFTKIEEGSDMCVGAQLRSTFCASFPLLSRVVVRRGSGCNEEKCY